MVSGYVHQCSPLLEPIGTRQSPFKVHLTIPWSRFWRNSAEEVPAFQSVNLMESGKAVDLRDASIGGNRTPRHLIESLRACINTCNPYANIYKRLGDSPAAQNCKLIIRGDVVYHMVLIWALTIFQVLMTSPLLHLEILMMKMATGNLLSGPFEIMIFLDSALWNFWTSRIRAISHWPILWWGHMASQSGH